MDRLDKEIELICRRFPWDKAIWFNGVWWSRRAFWELVEATTEKLHDSGFGPKMHLALVMPNTPSFWAHTLAAWRLGGAIVPYNMRESASLITNALEHVKASLVVISDKRTDIMPALEHIAIPWAVAPSDSPYKTSVDVLALRPGEEDTAVIFYTSGTGGKPKAVPLSHQSLYANTMTCMEQVEPIEEGDTLLNALPDSHVLGFSICGLLPLLLNLSQCMLPSFMPVKNVLESIRNSETNVLVGVPMMYQFIVSAVSQGASLPRRIKVAISGGDKFPVDLDEALERYLGIGVLEGYGLTEASPVVAVNRSYPTRKLGTVGPALPIVETKVCDPDGNELPPGHEGVLWIRGISVARSYFSDELLTNLSFKDGWFNTGDIVSIDSDGYIKLHSRESDVIMVGGFKVFPEEVEEVLLRHPSVKEAAVVGINQSMSGQLVKAFIVPYIDKLPSKRDIWSHCRKMLASYKIPKVIEFVNDLPKTALGKAKRSVLREG
ncbi:MAG TPA: AMP-binding protein [Acetomicrobium flavidum]|uniref:Acyl-CoA synthetase (AMP-forming)/AMP-acid ligase II n=1 Tax=Acetomicrobium mobile (strain ATCC BAA-54 / DSM 13181 / JCM 12221 / NGA) TaxID=891968 RepID=I4BYM3_ACEMN|nr:AMP-binding protein [Acetomicrobium mobile]AFM22380.1 acyl-CoA synthetase (AMP-forming)/AMP-acid ligase II [Acetomicrobium mobile DSM 13181]HOP87829.1 AMP-binding protein [Acetomicrobium flavidum]HPU68669.1 AMP-binding protein [Acetomicrobium flavidum]